eukprot:GHVU01058054.1.p2 GENE.GHVU01058054.1~~GHVU01058054.1.p2  ORF type:complete len:109 (-),score=5.44 GHVU01058054.1:170-496(-)
MWPLGRGGLSEWRITKLVGGGENTTRIRLLFLLQRANCAVGGGGGGERVGMHPQSILYTILPLYLKQSREHGRGGRNNSTSEHMARVRRVLPCSGRDAVGRGLTPPLP